MSLGEFEIISSYFTRKKKRKDTLLGIGDDCAALLPPSGKKLLVSTDTLNIEQHFFQDTPAYDIGYKSVAVSLSDLAAMGAEPAWLLLSLTLPQVNPIWLEEFSQGLFNCLDPFMIDLVGGNVSKGSLSITTTLLGFGDRLLTRHQAEVGDYIYVTGTLGDGGLSLAFLKKQIPKNFLTATEKQWLKSRLFKPPCRINESLALSSIASAAIDISDGLLADLSHIVNASHVGAYINLAAIPFSSALKKMPREMQIEMGLISGEDYELCFTIPPDKAPKLKEIAKKKGYHFTFIGKIEEQEGVRVIGEGGELLSFEKFGFRHF